MKQIEITLKKENADLLDFLLKKMKEGYTFEFKFGAHTYTVRIEKSEINNVEVKITEKETEDKLCFVEIESKAPPKVFYEFSSTFSIGKSFLSKNKGRIAQSAFTRLINLAKKLKDREEEGFQKEGSKNNPSSSLSSSPEKGGSLDSLLPSRRQEESSLFGEDGKSAGSPEVLSSPTRRGDEKEASGENCRSAKGGKVNGGGSSLTAVGDASETSGVGSVSLPNVKENVKEEIKQLKEIAKETLHLINVAYNAFFKFNMDEPTEEQIKTKKEIVAYLKRLREGIEKHRDKKKMQKFVKKLQKNLIKEIEKYYLYEIPKKEEIYKQFNNLRETIKNVIKEKEKEKVIQELIEEEHNTKIGVNNKPSMFADFRIFMEMGTDKKLIRRVKKLFRKIFDSLSSEGAESNRINVRKLIERVETYRDPFIDTLKEELTTEGVLMLMDLSGSMSSYYELGIPLREVSKIHKEFILVLNDNSYPIVLVREGQVQEREFRTIYSDAPVEFYYADDPVEFYSEIIKRNNISLVICISDWDGMETYIELFRKFPNLRWIFIDNYCCSVYDYIPQKRPYPKHVDIDPRILPKRFDYYIAVGDVYGVLEVLEKET